MSFLSAFFRTKPIRILDALKWNGEIEEYFFRHKCKKLPIIDSEYYQRINPLSFDPQKKIEEFQDIERSIRRKLGQFSGVGSIMERMCYEYIRVIEMLQSRGTRILLKFLKNYTAAHKMPSM